MSQHYQTGADSCSCGNVWPCQKRSRPAQEIVRDLELKAIAEFKYIELVYGNQVDSNNEHDWWSVSLGFFIGRGFLFTRAIEMARVAAYGGEL